MRVNAALVVERLHANGDLRAADAVQETFSKPFSIEGECIMLWTIVVILIVLWLLGLLGGIGGNLVHILLVLALIMIVINLLGGRRV
jgi:hypothetical protein